MTQSLNHMPWDNGALRLFGEILAQRTIKTRCGKRVAFTVADERKPITCLECAVEIECERAAHEEIHKYAATQLASIESSIRECGERLAREVSDASADLKRFPKLGNGLTPDSVKVSPEWRAAKSRYDAAFQRLREHNAEHAMKRR
jgi:hypothetical protein